MPSHIVNNHFNPKSINFCINFRKQIKNCKNNFNIQKKEAPHNLDNHRPISLSVASIPPKKAVFIQLYDYFNKVHIYVYIHTSVSSMNHRNIGELTSNPHPDPNSQLKWVWWILNQATDWCAIGISSGDFLKICRHERSFLSGIRSGGSRSGILASGVCTLRPAHQDLHTEVPRTRTPSCAECMKHYLKRHNQCISEYQHSIGKWQCYDDSLFEHIHIPMIYDEC